MKLDFSRAPRNIPPECVPMEYKFQMETRRDFAKQQKDHNRFYLKYLGVFLLVATSYFVFLEKEISSKFLIGTIVVGVGVLYIMLSSAVFLDQDCDWTLARCIEEGKRLEQDFPDIISTKRFHRFDAAQIRERRTALTCRFCPFAIVLILTAIAGIVLSLKIGFWLAVSIGIFSLIFLIASFFLFNWIIRRNFK